MAIIKKDGNFMGLPMNIARGNPIPLDTTEVWYDRADLEAYARSGATAYVGQIVQLVDEAAQTATAYIIANINGDLVEVGAAALGDNKTIELTEDGILRIKGADTAAVGAQLVMGSDGIISWTMPDASTIEGLNTTVSSLQTTVQNHETRLSTAEDEIDTLRATLAGMGGIFNFAGSYTTDQLANISADDFNVGDVILVDGTKEYVCIEYTEEGNTKKRWEVLGDPSGVTALEGRVNSLETWKTSASTSISTLETDVANAKSNITTLTNKDTELETAISGKASQTDLDTAKGRIKTNEDNIKALQEADAAFNTTLANKADTTYVDNKIKDVNTALADKADQTALQGVIDTMATDTELSEGLAKKVNVSDYNTKMSALETADTNNATAIENTKKIADQNKKDIESINTTLEGKADSATVSAIDTRVGTLETTVSGHTTSINSLNGSITGLQTNKADKTTVTDLDTRVGNAEKAISDHAAEYTALKERVDTAESDIDQAQADATKGINDAAAAATAASTAQTAADNAMNKANAVLGTAEDDATKKTVYGALAAAAAADAKAVTAQGEVDALEIVVNNLKSASETADAGLDSRIDVLEGVIGGVQGAMHFVGVSTIDPATGVVAITGKDDYAPVNGDVVIYKDAENNSIEYIYSDGSWVELGDVSAEAKRIEALEGRMDTTDTATAKIPGIEEDIAALETAKTNLENRMKGVEDINTAQATAIDNLEKRMDAAEKSITDTAAAIRGELATEVETLQGSINAEASARATADANFQTQINTINNQLTWVKFGVVES